MKIEALLGDLGYTSCNSLTKNLSRIVLIFSLGTSERAKVRDAAYVNQRRATMRRNKESDACVALRSAEFCAAILGNVHDFSPQRSKALVILDGTHFARRKLNCVAPVAHESSSTKYTGGK